MFKKGQDAFLIDCWDHLGAFRIRPVTVYSCGKKRMVLTHRATGEEIGNNFYPQREQWSFGVVILGTETDAEAVALEQAAAWRTSELAHFDRCLTDAAAGHAYINAITKIRDALLLAQPRFFWDSTPVPFAEAA